jgi:cobalamin biosynthesis protein CbiG
VFEERRRAARPVLERIDEVLRHQGGSRLAHDVDALGAVPVETTPAGVRGLAALDGVAAVLEDQPVRGLA